ncbi:hypothetical protein [Actinopolymorpha pittospori]
MRTSRASGPTTCGRTVTAPSIPNIQMTPQMPSTKRTMRGTSQGISRWNAITSSTDTLMKTMSAAIIGLR